MKNDAIMEYSFNLFLRDVREGSSEAVLFSSVIATLNENKKKTPHFSGTPQQRSLRRSKKYTESWLQQAKNPGS